jgi:hypothetical protein
MDVGQVLEGEKSGTVSLLGELLNEGTKTYTKEALDEKVDFIGARLSTSGNGVSAGGLSKYAEDLFARYRDLRAKKTMLQPFRPGFLTREPLVKTTQAGSLPPSPPWPT